MKTFRLLFSPMVLAAVASLLPLFSATAADPRLPQVNQEDSLKSLQASMLYNWQYISHDFIALADAMPEDKYSFAPSNGEFHGVRTFAQQVKHVACANFGFFREIQKLTPPEGCERGEPAAIKAKAEIMKYLRDSFDYADKVIATVNPQNMIDRVDGPYAGPNTKIGMIMVATWHQSDHYGQMVEYARMCGIVPPASR